MHNYYYYLGIIQASVIDIIHVKALSFLFSYLHFIFYYP